MTLPPVGMLPVGLAGAGLLAGLHARCFSEPWDEAAMASLLRSPGCAALVARTTGEAAEPVGLVLWRAAADEAEILTLGVIPAARRAGHGAALLAAVADFLTAAGIREIFLEVTGENTAARALYAAAGYADAGYRRGYYTSRRGVARARDALVMRLLLPVVNHRK